MGTCTLHLPPTDRLFSPTTQQHGKDYFDTFSPVTKPITIRTILSIALSKNWSLRQLDVNNAFLHGTLHEDVFMTQPPGYINPEFPHHICKLKKALYGLKQAPRAWYIELTNFLLHFGFRKSLADASLFIYQAQKVTCYLLVYVDDIVLAGNDSQFLDHFVNALSKKFSIKDLGILHHFLGVEVVPTPTDSDWGGVNDVGRSTTAYILYLGTNIISWNSTRQKSVSRSSTEAEYKALANASAELCWTKNILHELGIPTNHTPTLFCDNTGATYLYANPVYHSRMKHVALDYHFVREQVSAGQLRVLHISSQDQLADMLTKPLTRAPFLRNRSKIGVSNGSSILRGRIKNNHSGG
ncbi:retrovirus-related pol polyprotein from transposon RE1 [Tanacetum coccineum]